MNTSKKNFHRWSCKCPSNISPAVLSRGLRFWLSCAESTNWNWGVFSKCDIRCVSDFGSLGVHSWSFMWRTVLAMAAVMRWFWQSLGLGQKSHFLLVRPISPSVTEKIKRNAFGDSILYCENSQENMYPRGILTGKESRKQCWLLQWWQCNGRDTKYLDMLWNMINFWWLLADLTIKIKFNFI